MSAGLRIKGGVTYWSGLTYPDGVTGVVLHGTNYVQFSTRSNLTPDQAQAVYGQAVPRTWIHQITGREGAKPTVLFDPMHKDGEALDSLTGLRGPLLVAQDTIPERGLVVLTAMEMNRVLHTWLVGLIPLAIVFVLLSILGIVFYRFAERTRGRREARLLERIRIRLTEPIEVKGHFIRVKLDQLESSWPSFTLIV
jgi:hypothetical protein